MTTTLTKDQAESIRYEGHALAQQLVSEHRWYDRFMIVYAEPSGELRGYYWDRPSTEDQEGQDEYEAIPIPTFPVDSREVTTTVYTRQPDAER